MDTTDIQKRLQQKHRNRRCVQSVECRSVAAVGWSPRKVSMNGVHIFIVSRLKERQEQQNKWNFRAIRLDASSIIYMKPNPDSPGWFGPLFKCNCVCVKAMKFCFFLLQFTSQIFAVCQISMDADRVSLCFFLLCHWYKQQKCAHHASLRYRRWFCVRPIKSTGNSGSHNKYRIS